MAVFYREGEVKKRPGVYQRHTKVGFNTIAGAQDGYCAIPVKASWGPLGKVVKHTSAAGLEKTYGTGTYGEGYTVPAAAAMFDGGAAVVYTYRLGTGGTKASKELAEGLTATAKYEGTMPLSVAVQTKISDSSKKQLLVYAGSALVESWDFDADSEKEGANLIEAASTSKYLDFTGEAAEVPVLAVATGGLAGGANPTVTNEDYSKAFAAFEVFFYNTIALDVDDTDLALSTLLQEYLVGAYKMGKLGIAVVGEKTTVPFETRLAHAKTFNDEKVVYLGGGFMEGTDSRDGVLAICYTAGVIASTPSNRGITHTVIEYATDLCESLTYAQYEEAINAGMLLLSRAPDGSIWYDSAINTLTSLTEEQDEGWKKIRRVKVRFEMIDRLDRELAPKVGRVSRDSDGIADIIQSGQRILNAMSESEGKLAVGALFTEDTETEAEVDSAYFIVRADDIDSLEKIYLQYQFRYSQNS